MRTLVLISSSVLALSACAAALNTPEQDRAELGAIEQRSHQLWRAGQLDELGELMDEAFRFVAMNGAVETKEHVIGRPGERESRGPRPLQVRALEVAPRETILHGDVAVVVADMRIDATVGGRQIPEQMTVLSVFRRERAGAAWRLVARSITPVLSAER